jgi:quinoprotein glucose dehydrogenase
LHTALAKSALVQKTKQLLAEGMANRSLNELADLLAHPDMRVRQEAQFALAEKGAEARMTLVEVSRTSAHQLARLHAVWGLGQQGQNEPEALALILPLLGDPDAEVRGQAAKVLGEAKFGRATAKLLPLLHDDHPRVRFFAAIALGRLARPEAVQPVLQMLRENADRDAYLRHAGVMCLVGCGDPKALGAAADDNSSAVRLGVLLALRRLESPEVARFLNDTDPRLVLEAARAINDVPINAALPQLAALGRHSGLSEPVLYRVLNANYRLGKAENAAAVTAIATRSEAPGGVRLEALRALGQWAKPPGRDRVVGLWRPLPQRSPDAAVNSLRSALPDLFRGPDDVRQEAARVVGELGIKEAGPFLRRLLADNKAATTVRVETLKALAALKDEHFEEAMQQALADADLGLRIEGRRLLASLRPDQAVGELAKALETGSQPEQQGALAVLGDLNTPAGDKLLLEWMRKLLARKVPLAIQLDLLEAAARRGTPELQSALEAFEASRPKGDPLASYRECLAGGDAAAGQKIFAEKAEVACMRCHKVHNEGGTVGPDLSGIGARKDRRYLLESIVDPNKQIAEGFETLILELGGVLPLLHARRAPRSI